MEVAVRETSAVPVQFGPFELDLQAFELKKRGHRLKLGPQPIKVLALLASRSGQLVTREELQQVVWGNNTFIDFEQGLNFCIRQLRATLDDDAESPRYIETVPRRGYRFVGKVLSNDRAGAAEASNNSKSTEKSEVQEPGSARVDLPAIGFLAKRRWLPMVAAIALALASVSGLYLFLKQRAGFANGAPQSLAVLPLLNLSSDAEQEYFADGMTDELITELAQFRNLRVISHASVMQYKGSSKPLPQIASELKVDAVIEGTVLRLGNRVRITAQLVQAYPERHLWADSYDREEGDVFTLQSELAQDIARRIGITVTPPQRSDSQPGTKVHPQAHEAYLRGRYWWHRRGTEAELKGLQYFEQAVQFDPAYALGWAGVADSYLVLAHHGGMPPKEAMPKAKVAALKAIQLDPSLAEAHTSLAAVKMAYDWDYAAAEKEFLHAIKLNPNYPTAHHWYSHFLVITGRFPEALHEIQVAHDLDPYSMTINFFWGLTLYYSRDYERALAQFRAMADLDPSAISQASTGLAQVYEQQGDYTRSVEQRRKMSGAAQEAAALADAFATTGAEGYWKERIALAKRQSSTSALELAILYARQGNRGAALESLERAYQEHSPWLNFMAREPAFDPLRSDPQFRRLAHEVGVS